MKYTVILYNGVNEKITRSVEVDAKSEAEAFEKAKKLARENSWKERYGLTIKK